MFNQGYLAIKITLNPKRVQGFGLRIWLSGFLGGALG